MKYCYESHHRCRLFSDLSQNCKSLNTFVFPKFLHLSDLFKVAVSLLMIQFVLDKVFLLAFSDFVCKIRILKVRTNHI